MRIVQISDPHLSATHTHFAANNAVVRSWLADQTAEVIVNTGDLGMDGAADPADLALAAQWHAGLPAPVLSVPGNHDVGDHPAIRPSQPVNDDRLATWREIIGDDRWTIDRGGWRLIGINAMLLGTGHPEEQRQHDWLAAALKADAPIAMFLHKPLFVDHPDEDARGYWTVPPAPRHRLLQLMAAAPVRLVASGHLHIHRQFHHAGIDHVWGASAAFVCGDSQEDLGGARRVGVVEHVFGADRVTSRLIRAEGLADLPIDPVMRQIYPVPATTEPAA